VSGTAAFEGVAEVYESARLGYPAELGLHLVEIGALSDQSLVVDLGAGTGQLVRLVADVAADVVAVEPEIEMLRVGERVTAELPSVRWIHGRDADLLNHFEPAEIDLVVIGNAFHHMDQHQLLADLDVLIAADGGLCVATSSVPVWLQDTDWSLALRSVIEDEFGPLEGSGVPDAVAAAETLRSSAFSDVATWSIQREGRRSCGDVIGELLSSASGRLGPALQDRLLAAIEPCSVDGWLPETITSTAVIGFRPPRERGGPRS